jgi:hypothetical protein
LVTIDQAAIFDSLNPNRFGPDCRTGSGLDLSRAKQVCSDATTWAPSPTDDDPAPGVSRRRNVCGHHRGFHPCCRLAVSYARVALPNFYNIAIRISNVAARLAVLRLRLRDELGSSTSPKFITRLNIGNADIHKAAD